jgi:hypothetical protein
MRQLALALSLTGCCLGASAPTPPAAPVGAPVAAAEPVPPPPPSERTAAAATHVVVYVDDELDECVSTVVQARAPADSEGDLQGSVEEVVGGLTAEGAIRLPVSCDEQFGGRTVLASCAITSVSHDAGEHVSEVSVAITATYFRFESALDSDGYERDCLTGGGRWSEVAEGTPEYARAELDAISRRVRGRRR